MAGSRTTPRTTSASTTDTPTSDQPTGAVGDPSAPPVQTPVAEPQGAGQREATPAEAAALALMSPTPVPGEGYAVGDRAPRTIYGALQGDGSVKALAGDPKPGTRATVLLQAGDTISTGTAAALRDAGFEAPKQAAATTEPAGTSSGSTGGEAGTGTSS